MQVIKITVTLRYVEPRVTRRLEVPADIPLDRLHETLQAAFGWQNAHLYQFCMGEPYRRDVERWVMPGFGDDPRRSARRQNHACPSTEQSRKKGLTYLYDFGDDWEHKIAASAATSADPAQTYPRLIKATGNCPPEDIGGPPGYEMFVEAIADPKHPEHKNFKDWYEGPFDPSKADEKTLKANVKELAKLWLG